MKIEVQKKSVLLAWFMCDGKMIGGIKWDAKDNVMFCQFEGQNGSVITFWEGCWNDGKDIDNAISRMKRELTKEYKDVTFTYNN